MFSLFIITIFNLLLALPRFATQNGTNCIACHVNPTGGALRNDYGTNIVSIDELPMNFWSDEANQDWDGFINDIIQIGGDIRLQGMQYHKDGEVTSAFFPMQLEIYTFSKLHENAGIYTELGILGKNKLSSEFWGLINSLPFKSWLKIGKTLPNYGLKIDDHSSFIRGGNINRALITDFEKEGLIFTPYIDPPLIIELGSSIISGLEFTSSLSTTLLQNDSSEGLKNFTSQLYYFKNHPLLNHNFSISYMKDGELLMSGISAGINYKSFIYTYELDQIQNWINDYTSIAIYNEIAWEIIQGLQLIGKYDYFDPSMKHLYGSISRYSFGMEIYPINIIEFKVQARINSVDIDNFPKSQPEYLIQTHLWF
tara:strand:- start:362 stop:1465 length:1104 start_codon:yes stop_codon:yes gene_type:complete